jgi:propionyl-CoA synthetase
MTSRYHKLFDLQKAIHAASLARPLEFWRAAAAEIAWKTPYDQVYSRSRDEWFAGGELNMAYNALDRHVEKGNGHHLALIYDSAATNTICKFSYAELLASVKLLAGYLRNNGISSSSKVLIYIPAIPQAVIAMLACARIGAVHTVVFGGFAARELAVRLQDSKSDVIITASYGLENTRKIDYLKLVDRAIELSAYKPRFTLVFDRDLERFGTESSLVYRNFRQWQQEEKKYKQEYGLMKDNLVDHPGTHCTMVQNYHPLYILHTSGSTGTPKGIIRQTGPYAVGLSWSTKNVYDIDQREVIWSASDVGWVVGHSFIVYGPLLRGATTVLFEGKPVGQPDSSVFFRVMAQHNVKTFFCAPTALRAIKREDPNGLMVLKHGTSKALESVFLAGERCDPDSIKWCQKIMNNFANGRHIEILDHWWSTEVITDRKY